MLRKRATFELTEQCENAFKLLNEELAKICQAYNIQALINLSNYLQMHLSIVTLEFSTKRRKEKEVQMSQN